MNIVMTGIDHSKADLDIRSLFSFTKKSMEEALRMLKETEGISGAVIISTCNLMECYINCRENAEVDLPGLLCRLKGQKEDVYRDFFIVRKNMDAVTHLFALAAGLKSKILGEDQIITQVREAQSFSRDVYGADQVLDTLFRMAVTAAKKVKTEVVLSHENRSIVSAAISQMKRSGFVFDGKKCMVIGNGVMGKLTASTLKNEGAEVTVTVRQYRSGIVEIPEGCSRIHYGERMELFPQMDVVVSATSSPNYTLTREVVEGHVPEKGILLLDLAVPRDIDPLVKELSGVSMYDVDDFQSDLLSEDVKENLVLARAIIDEQAKEFLDWYECRNIIPVITDIKEKAAKDLLWRVTGTIKKLPLTEEEKQQLSEQLLVSAAKTVNKMLFGLRDEVEQKTFRECLEGLEQVYDTDE